jgi:Tol biopolymer transport system component/DNA-binding winged helix-turn-helix (wHTH) protein
MAEPEPQPHHRLLRFGNFEVDPRAGELRKAGMKLKLSGQPFQVLCILLERPGEVTTREELQKRLWPNTFVDVDHNLNTAINKIREVLGDSAESPRFVETLPRRGYRFIAPVGGGVPSSGQLAEELPPESEPPRFPQSPPPAEKSVPRPKRTLTILATCCACVLLVGAGWFAYKKWHANLPATPVQRALTRLTSEDGLQTGATWSADGRFIAYASDRGGKFEIWVQQVSGGDPIQITKGPAQNWQPDWSPDGKYIAYRSEEGDGGIYITPALGGAGQQRKIASFGYSPLWSPDSSRILLQQTGFLGKKIYVIGLDGSPPREVLTDQERNQTVMFSTWHPDGRRITSWVVNEAKNLSSATIPQLWTEPLDGGPAVETRFPPELQKQIEAVAATPGVVEFRTDFRFAWAPSGNAIYFERTFRGARNVWRMTVDPVTLQAVKVERLTTSPGLDAEFAISRDGSKLAFTSERQQIRGWDVPLNANGGRITGPGQPVTSPGIEAWNFDLSPDGRKLAVGGDRDGRIGIWLTSVPNGREEPMVPDDAYLRDAPIWSPDGKWAAYVRHPASYSSNTSQVVAWSTESHNEYSVGQKTSNGRIVYDWSRDGKSLLIVQANDPASPPEIWQLPIDKSKSEPSARRIASDPNYELYQPHMSPNGRWIVFDAVSYLSHSAESTLYTIPSAGGPPESWNRITDSRQWDDKPRWSPDGKTIYYLSERRGFFNLWGMHFDPVNGKPQGKPFQVTSFESPNLMIPRQIPAVDISITSDRLILPLALTSGNIWILDNVDR